MVDRVPPDPPAACIRRFRAVQEVSVWSHERRRIDGEGCCAACCGHCTDPCRNLDSDCRADLVRTGMKRGHGNAAQVVSAADMHRRPHRQQGQQVEPPAEQLFGDTAGSGANQLAVRPELRPPRPPRFSQSSAAGAEGASVMTVWSSSPPCARG